VESGGKGGREVGSKCYSYRSSWRNSRGCTLNQSGGGKGGELLHAGAARGRAEGLSVRKPV
jgi:hypothetical protein